MFRKQIDILCIGDITTDAFIRLKDAHIHCKLNHHDCELCMRFGAKVPFEYIKVVKAVGNAANVAVLASRFGLYSALVSNVGDDQNGKECLIELQKNGVVTSFIKREKNKPTNYHFVLWYSNDRTILVNHVEYDYDLPKFPTPKWIYLTSIGDGTFSYHEQIYNYLNNNPKIKLAFQPGTFQLKTDFKKMEMLYKRADVLSLNLEEAEALLINSSKTRSIFKEDPKSLLKYLHNIGPKLVIITDGPRGAYMYDGEHSYFMPIYPDPKPPLERTGCGDAWTGTFVSALAMGKTPLEALVLAPINPMSVAQYIGSQEGLLKYDQLDWWLDRAPEDYKPKEI